MEWLELFSENAGWVLAFAIFFIDGLLSKTPLVKANSSLEAILVGIKKFAKALVDLFK